MHRPVRYELAILNWLITNNTRQLINKHEPNISTVSQLDRNPANFVASKASAHAYHEWRMDLDVHRDSWARPQK
jgi:hypothetical protein